MESNQSSAAAIGRRAFSGLASLGLREGGMRIVAFAGDVALYRLLLPEVFGLVIPIAFLAGIIKQFSDLGLAATLLQQSAEPSESDLRIVFTVQAVLVVIAASIIFIGGPFLLDVLDEGSPNPWLIRVFAASVLVSAFRAVPAAMLERHLNFGRLAFADVSGTIWFYTVGIFLAVIGVGPWALVAAHVGASIVPTLLLLFFFPWRPVPTIQFEGLRRNLDFGAKFQMQRILLMVKDSLIPLLGPVGFGRTATGLLAWGDKLAQQPLILTQLVARVSLPAFSRVQEQREAVAHGAYLAIKWTCLLTFPFFSLVFAFAVPIADIIYGPSWSAAVPVLYLLIGNAVLVPINGLLTPIINALGHSGRLLLLAAGWALAAWLVALVLFAIGVGFASIAVALVATQVAALLYLAPLAARLTGINVARAAGLPAVIAAVVGVIAWVILSPLVTNLLLLCLWAFLAIAVYALALYALDGENLRREARDVLRYRRRPDSTLPLS